MCCVDVHLSSQSRELNLSLRHIKAAIILTTRAGRECAMQFRLLRQFPNCVNKDPLLLVFLLFPKHVCIEKRNVISIIWKLVKVWIHRDSSFFFLSLSSRWNQRGEEAASVSSLLILSRVAVSAGRGVRRTTGWDLSCIFNPGCFNTTHLWGR